MTHDLIARYIYAVTRHLPSKIRGEVAQELDGLISDMLAERCGDILPAEKDIRIVLIELGAPEELAAKYSGDENKSLIGGIYFLIYKRVLWLVLPITAAGIVFARVMTSFLDGLSDQHGGWDMAGQIIGGVLWGALQAFAIVTIIFAILAYKKVNFYDGDSLSKLPPVPQKKEQIKPHDPIISILLSIVAAIILIGFPQIVEIWLDGTGWILLPDTSIIIRSLWLPVVLWTVFSVAKETMKLIEARYTKKLAYVTLVANVLIFICSAFFFLNYHILNPDFIPALRFLIPGDNNIFLSIVFAHFNFLFLGIVSFSLIAETAITMIKAWKYNKA